MSGPPALPGQQRDHCCHVAPNTVASYGQALSIQAIFLPAPGDPLRRHVALLKGCRVPDLRAEPIHREHDRGPGSDREFAHQPIMRLRAPEHPPGAVDVHDDGEYRLRVRWPQDAQSDLTAWAAFNREILDVDRQRAHLARLRLIEGEP